MMKKTLSLLAVAAMVCASSLAFAADVTVGGSVQVRSRDFSGLSFDKDNTSKNQVDTQQRVMIDINAKVSDDVKGKISVWNDFDNWNRLEVQQGANVGSGPTGTTAASPTVVGFREAWVNFNVPGLPLNVTAGHQLLALGNEWFLRNKHFGSDAWVVANVTGNNTAALVDIKVAEGSTAKSDDVDAYALLDVYKIDDNNMVGAYFANVRFGTSDNTLQNLGLHYGGKVGIVNLKAQLDLQMGTDKTGGADSKYKGNEFVVQGNVPVDAVTINFLVGRGSGHKSGGSDTDEYVNFLDIDPHFGLIYEYKVGVGGTANAHQGLSNVTAINLGASYAVSDKLKVGANLWMLQTTEKVAAYDGSGDTNEIGNEIDVNIGWKLYDNLTWNWDLGYLAPGKALGKDAATGVMGILALKF